MKVLSRIILGAAVILSGCTQEETVPAKPDKAPFVSTTPAPQTAMVAAANPHAVDAGLEILRAGGSAVDAAIAVQTVLGLVEPQSSGIGGGAFMLVYDNQAGEVWNYNGRETAPADISPDLFKDENGQPLRYFDGIASGRSTGVPGAMVMLHRAYEDYGKIDWGPQFEPAIRLAEDGFEVSPRMAMLVERMSKYVLNRQEAAREYFFLEDGTTPIPVGFLRDNPAYAETLKALQNNPRALLEGPVAEAIIAATREEPLPGTMTLEDMAKYQPIKRRALCSTYRAYTVCGAQPPSSGGVAVMALLGMLENFDMSEIGATAEGWHRFSEASFLAYADRDQYVADDAFVPVHTDLLLDKSYLKSRAKLISADKAIVDVQAGQPYDFEPGTDATPDSPGTSHFTIVDSTGLTVSMTTTVEAAFGSQRMAAGFMLNNQLTDFSFRTHDDQGRPIANAPEAGKRPRSSMSPTIVFDPDGQLLFTTGSPGGSSIIAYTAKTIVGMLDWGYSPQEAIELPNVIARNGSIRLEENKLDPDIITALETRGHKVIRSKGEISGIHIIWRNPDGTLTGGADPRREGVAKTP